MAGEDVDDEQSWSATLAMPRRIPHIYAPALVEASLRAMEWTAVG